MEKTSIERLIDWINEDIEQGMKEHNEMVANGTLPTPAAIYDENLNRISEIPQSETY